MSCALHVMCKAIMFLRSLIDGPGRNASIFGKAGLADMELAEHRLPSDA